MTTLGLLGTIDFGISIVLNVFSKYKRFFVLNSFRIRSIRTTYARMVCYIYNNIGTFRHRNRKNLCYLCAELSMMDDSAAVWAEIVKSYWSLLSPLLFSDHPKRPGEEDPMPPPNIVRSVMDMNALHGNLQSALAAAKKPVWVMNVVPRNALDTLPSVFARGLIGTRHDW